MSSVAVQSVHLLSTRCSIEGMSCERVSCELQFHVSLQLPRRTAWPQSGSKRTLVMAQSDGSEASGCAPGAALLLHPAPSAGLLCKESAVQTWTKR